MKLKFLSAQMAFCLGFSGIALAADAPVEASFDALPREQVSPAISRQVLHGENLTVSRWVLKAGAKVPMHKHPNEQVSLVLSGRSEARSGGRTYVLGPGDLLLFPPDVEHEFVILEDAVVLDFFAPRRDDWIAAALSAGPANAPLATPNVEPQR